MKRRTGFLAVLFPLVMTISLYLVFYPGIESKPNHAGFWFILVLGMSLGIALTRLIQWLKEKNNK
jgi:hypothetical protein